MDYYKNLGIKHALKYPVTVTGLLIPYQPLLNFFKADTKNPLKKLNGNKKIYKYIYNFMNLTFYFKGHIMKK